MQKYQIPMFKKLQKNEILMGAQTQYLFSLNFDGTQCAGFPSQTIVTNGVFEVCVDSGEIPFSGDTFSFKCTETGGTTYEAQVTNVVDGSMTCGDGEVPQIISASASSQPPTNCQLTSFIFEGFEFCFIS